MMNQTEEQTGKGPCLEDDDFYAYLTRSPGKQTPAGIAAHLGTCARCREELAELIRMLHPEERDVSEAVEDPSPQEIENTLALIQRTEQSGQKAPSHGNRWYRWGAVAAAAVFAIGLCSAVFLLLYERSRSQALYDEARASLQAIYAPQSPGDLRLDLPFKSAISQRAASAEDSLESAERSFNRALGVREGMRDALLGLGYVQLRKGQFIKAQEAFEIVLGARGNDAQALLGRGVSRFEEGMSVTDPAVRNAKLHGALADFERVLGLKPESNEARYDRIRALFEIGRHKEALQEIDAYLARDADSIWAVKLRNLKTRILTNRSEAIGKEVYRAAKARDAPALDALVRVAPHRILPTLRSLVIDTIAFEDQPQTKEMPGSSDLQWATNVLASAYSSVTGDKSCSRLLDFYADLTAPQRRTKKDLDARLERLIASYAGGDTQSGLRNSEPLIRGFEGLHDYWELVRVYQLRGSACFLGKADYGAATREYHNMLGSAELSSDPDLIARSLSSLASASIHQHRYDEAIGFLSHLKDLSEAHRMEGWTAFASYTLGGTLFKLNQIDQSLQEYSSALAISYRLMNPVVLVSSMQGLGEIMARRGRFKEARSYYDQSGEWQNAFIQNGIQLATPETESQRLDLLSKQGYLALHAKDPAGAEVRFKQALNPLRSGMRDLEAINRIGLAQAYIEEKRFAEAQAEVGIVLNMMPHDEYPEIAWQVNSLKGFLLKQAADPAGALDYFQRAGRILIRMRSGISSSDLRQSFFAQRYEPFREIVSLLYQVHGSPIQILEQADRAKAMTLREYLSSRVATAGSARPSPSWTEGKSLSDPLPPGIFSLEYFLASDQVFAFVTGPRGTELTSLNLPAVELEVTVNRYLDSIRGNDGNAFEALSRKLHHDLIDPILARLELRTLDTLVIIPDGPLHMIPFGSLKDSSGHYLLERFTLSYAPSRSILLRCLAMNKPAVHGPESRVLLMDGTSNLPGASQELAYLARLYAKNSRLVAGGDLATLGAMVGDYEIIHFSGHASLDQGKPRLVFHGIQGETYADYSMIESWHLRNNWLVSLLGCSTGIGPIFDGETPWGLVPAFLSAGAPSLLVSLLPVDDIATRNLTARFYDLMARDNVSKASALRQAQLSVMNGRENGAPVNPISWAPFVLVGEPR